MVTVVGAVTSPGSNPIVPVLCDEATGRIDESLETTKYGGTPPETVNVAGVLEYTVATDGKIDHRTGRHGLGCERIVRRAAAAATSAESASAASASVASAGRSQRTFKRFGTMSGFLMILS